MTFEGHSTFHRLSLRSCRQALTVFLIPSTVSRCARIHHDGWQTLETTSFFLNEDPLSQLSNLYGIDSAMAQSQMPVQES